ncbi:MAG: hypothetical protein H9W81_14985 [Enterococcus sp.]|nr:hypothetical protein [Enterococcus sp.]
MYFKNEQHKSDTYQIIQNFGKEFGKDAYYDSFSYLMALSGKSRFVLKHSGTFGIDSKAIKEGMQVFSSSEKGMIALAMQLFNSGMSDVTIHDVLSPLSKENAKAVLTALEIRYGLR